MKKFLIGFGVTAMTLSIALVVVLISANVGIAQEEPPETMINPNAKHELPVYRERARHKLRTPHALHKTDYRREALGMETSVQIKTAELNEFMAQFEGQIAVHFENMASGFTFSYQGYRQFFGASATKAPFAFYIYKKAERGATNLDAIMTFTEGDFWEGSGIIRHNYEYGQTFTQRRLLHLMMSPSDNIATRILRRHHGLTGYREFIASLGGNPHYIQTITYSYLSANEAGFYLREFYRYITSDSQFGHIFKQNLLDNRYPFIRSDYPVGSKSGWAGNFGGAWHDMAIIFAPSAYTLALLSSLEGTPADRAMYNQISDFMQDFNTRWFTQ